jgi:peptidoglycan/LPS O-acetylase OafA/YrhL
MQGYLKTLDGWRAVAIIGVMVYHATTSLFYPYGPHPSYRALVLIQLGAKGVDIFFGISGLLICNRLLGEWRASGRIRLRDFYLRRTFRILPPYALYLAVLGLIAAAGVLVVEDREWWGCALFLRNYIGPRGSPGWYTGHFWSLSVEEHFYLLWPGLLVVCGPRRGRWVVVLLALAVGAWRELDARFQWLSWLGPGGMRTDTRIDTLLWGCWMALLLEIPATRARLGRWLRPGVWLALVVALLACYRYHPPLESFWQSLLIPFLLVGTVLHPDGPAGRFLEWAPLRWLGRMSYSLYLWQQVFLLGSWRAIRPFPLGRLQELPLNLLGTFACAALSYYCVERPMIRLGKRLIESWDRPPRRLSAVGSG